MPLLSFNRSVFLVGFCSTPRPIFHGHRTKLRAHPELDDLSATTVSPKQLQSRPQFEANSPLSKHQNSHQNSISNRNWQADRKEIYPDFLLSHPKSPPKPRSNLNRETESEPYPLGIQYGPISNKGDRPRQRIGFFSLSVRSMELKNKLKEANLLLAQCCQ